jgi:uncharacterized protein YbjT (DUF2867 family)
MDGNLETAQGKTLVDAAKSANVDRLIFSSLPYVSKATNGANKDVVHFDSKALVEEYAREQGVPGTYFMPAVFMSGLLGNFKKDQASGVYTMATAMPADSTKMPAIDIVRDTGAYVAAILLDLPGTLNKRISAAGGAYSPDQLVADFKTATGKEAKVVSITWEQFKGFLPPPVAGELVANMKLIVDPGYFVGEASDSIEVGHKLISKAGLEKPNGWLEYVKENFKET